MDNKKTISPEQYYQDVSLKILNFSKDVIDKVEKILLTEYQFDNNKRLFIIGNGGSAAIAEHIATDLIKRCKVQAHTLSNNSLATALTNDYKHENGFLQWLKMYNFTENDFLIAISSSGKSENVLNAIQYAESIGSYTLSIFGMNGIKTTSNIDKNIYLHIPSDNYGVVELTTEIFLHGIVESLVIE